jgi:hypothetical protein
MRASPISLIQTHIKIKNHYKEGTDPEEKYLSSKLRDVSKQPCKIPFLQTAQTAKNVGSVVKCAECKKP